MDDDDEEKEKHDSSDAILHEFIYRIKNYFMESERALRVTQDPAQKENLIWKGFPSFFFGVVALLKKTLK